MFEQLKQKILSNKGGRNISFWFVRHAQSEGNALGDTCPVMHDTPLTEEGKEQARKIATYLEKEGIKITDIYSSPQGRAHQTAEIIAEQLGLSVKVKEDLRERDWGEWKDLCWSEVSERLDKLDTKERYTFVPEGGESWKQQEDRLRLALDEIADENTSGEDILIVMHRGGLRALLPQLAKVGIEKHKDFSVGTGTLSKFSFDKDDFDFIGVTPEL